jgi:predicted DNA-binding protein (MmcQ/YjbR family)
MHNRLLVISVGSPVEALDNRRRSDVTTVAHRIHPISGTMPRMDAIELRAWCLRQAGAIEEFPFGPATSVFKVAGKMFALSALDRTPLQVSVKCEPELAVGLRDSYPAIRPGYHLNKRHWNTITLDGSLPDQLVRELVEDSYDLIVSALPNRVREQLGWAPGRDPAAPVERPPDRRQPRPGAGRRSRP